MSTYNKAIIIGRLGRDPEPRQTNSGQTVLNISLATSRRGGSKDDRHEVTDWHRITLFGQPADFLAQYATKGALVMAEGYLVTSKYTDKEGIERRHTEVMATHARIMDRPKSGGRANAASDSGYPGSTDDRPNDDDIPF